MICVVFFTIASSIFISVSQNSSSAGGLGISLLSIVSQNICQLRIQ